MEQDISPIGVRPWTLNGISERMLVSHHENNYGAAVRTLNAVRRELAAMDAGTPGYRIRALKREELVAMGSVTLHELYFGNLGGDTRDVRAELGDVIAGRRPGRLTDDEIVIFDSTGTALQDVAAAVVVYERALATGRGVALELGA